MFTRSSASTRQTFGGTVHQNPPVAVRLPISSLVCPLTISACYVPRACPDPVRGVNRPSDFSAAPLFRSVAFAPLCWRRLGSYLQPSVLLGRLSLADAQTFRRLPAGAGSDVPTIRTAHHPLSTFFSTISKLFAPVAKLKRFVFSRIQTLFAKMAGYAISPVSGGYRGWRPFDFLTFRRSDIQTIPISPLESVLTHFSDPKSFGIRSYAIAPGVCQLLADNSPLFSAIQRSLLVTL